MKIILSLTCAISSLAYGIYFFAQHIIANPALTQALTIGK